MKVGIVGTGNMGTILIEALLDSKAVSPSKMIITNRTKSKAIMLKNKYIEIYVADSPAETIKQADIIFMCVKPMDIIHLINTHHRLFTSDKCLVSITSPIQVEWLEQMVASSCARIIPSITNRALAGVTLFSFGKNCKDQWKGILKEMFMHVSTPLEINEEIIRVSSDIVSCGPAFFSYLTQKFIEAAVSETEIDKETATILAEHMLIGLGDLLKKKFYTLPALQEKVCVKGGITGEGIEVLEQEHGEMFEKLFQATHRKFYKEAEIIKKRLDGK